MGNDLPKVVATLCDGATHSWSNDSYSDTQAPFAGSFQERDPDVEMSKRNRLGEVSLQHSCVPIERTGFSE